VSNRLPKQFWRVNIVKGKVGIYELGSKTYAAEGHAIKQAQRLERRGCEVDIYTTGPVEWTQTYSSTPANMDPLF
jgi:hypothetical protein